MLSDNCRPAARVVGQQAYDGLLSFQLPKVPAHMGQELLLCLIRRLEVLESIRGKGAQRAVSSGIGEAIAGPPSLQPQSFGIREAHMAFDLVDRLDAGMDFMPKARKGIAIVPPAVVSVLKALD
jgi:hypothetical protein